MIIDGKVLKIEKDGYFGPRYYNTNFENPLHGQLTDSTIYYSKDMYYKDSTVGFYFKRLRVYGTKK